MKWMANRGCGNRQKLEDYNEKEGEEILGRQTAGVGNENNGNTNLIAESWETRLCQKSTCKGGIFKWEK